MVDGHNSAIPGGGRIPSPPFTPRAHLPRTGSVRVGNTPWFWRVRWALCLCCFTPAPGEEASGSGQKCRCCLLHAWRWAEPPARLSQETKKHTNQNKTPVISRDRPFVLLRCVSQQQQQPTATGCLQSYVPRGLLSFVVVHRILFHSSCVI